jgi:predicted molibdopterin-dependent oxidoreductase YjgC
MSLEVTPKVLKITIDGAENEVVSGSMILDAILAQEIDIPHLCKSDSQGPLGACRTCLVAIHLLRTVWKYLQILNVPIESDAVF